MAKKKEPKKALIEDDIVAVKLADVSQANSTEAISASGLVTSLQEARLSFKTGGIIEKIYVKEGQNVQQGAIIGYVEPYGNQRPSTTSYRKRQ